MPFFVAHTVIGSPAGLWPTFLIAALAFGLGRFVQQCMDRKPPRTSLGWLMFALTVIGSLGYAFALVRAAGGELP